ncbi:hypothetical protein AB0K14_28335 [Actinosynnema sp. NPDC050801]
MAVSDSWTHPGDIGRASYNDNGDSYWVCDIKTDDIGVVGRINVKQADGSWHHFPYVRDGNGNNGDCSTPNNVDVIRENAYYTFTVCLQNTSGGTPYYCRESPQIPGA